MRRLGIDEAGRGCVLGPLVVGAFFVCDVADETLRATGAKDSKRLSPKRRASIRESLQPLGESRSIEITATEIDAGNLNALEEEVIISLIREFQPDEVYIDALGHPRTLPKLKERLLQALAPAAPTLIIEPKADQTYPIVSAASIFAKTTRDGRCESLKDAHGDFGSGYPSDPKTKAWLLEHATAPGPWPAFVRTRWGTVRDLETAHGAKPSGQEPVQAG